MRTSGSTSERSELERWSVATEACGVAVAVICFNKKLCAHAHRKPATSTVLVLVAEFSLCVYGVLFDSLRGYGTNAGRHVLPTHADLYNQRHTDCHRKQSLLEQTVANECWSVMA